jgi:flagellar biosynthesis/type III secretory pathway chaperone
MPAGAARVPVAHMIEPTILRLEEVIDQESEALRTRKAVDLKGFNERKNQALLELTRLMRHVQGGAGNPQLMERMAQVRAKLEINRALLKMHLEAVREIAEALSDAIRDAESDGTYNHTILANSRQQ